MQSPRIRRMLNLVSGISVALASGRGHAPPAVGEALIFVVDAAYENHYGFYPARAANILAARPVASTLTDRDGEAIRSAAATAAVPDARTLSAVLLAATLLDDAAAERLKTLGAVAGVIVTIIGDTPDDGSPEEYHCYLTPVIEPLQPAVVNEPTAGATRH